MGLIYVALSKQAVVLTRRFALPQYAEGRAQMRIPLHSGVFAGDVRRGRQRRRAGRAHQTAQQGRKRQTDERPLALRETPPDDGRQTHVQP